MAFYNTCPYCGSHLDPGERCDCQKEKAKKEEEMKKLMPKLHAEKGGQLTWITKSA